MKMFRRKSKKALPKVVAQSRIGRKLNFQTLENRCLLAADFVWANQFGGTGGQLGNSTVTDRVGNVYTLGSFSGTVDLNPGSGVLNATASGPTDAFLTKVNPAGSLVWARTFGGSGNTAPNAIAIDRSGSLLVSGAFGGTTDFDPGPGTAWFTATSAWNGFVSKFNADGTLNWARHLRGQSGAADVQANSFDDSVFVAGSFSGTCDFDPGVPFQNRSALNEDGYLLKLNAAGDFEWVLEFDGTNSSSRVLVDDIAINDMGQILMTGNFQGQVDLDPHAGTSSFATPDVFFDAFVTKITANGSFAWAQALTGTGSQVASDIVVNSWGDPIVGGTFSGTVDFDPHPGATFELTSQNADAYFWKLNAVGGLDWAKQVGGNNIVTVRDMTMDSQNSLYVAGDFGGTIDFNPGSGFSELSSNGLTDAFALKLNDFGNYLWVRQFGSSEVDEAHGIALDSGYNIVATGTFRQTVDFDPRSGVVNKTAVGGTHDAFSVKLTQTIVFPPHLTADLVTIRKSGTQIQFVDDTTGGVILSRFASVYLGVQIAGASGENERVTVDFDYGGPMTMPAGIKFSGGTGDSDVIRFFGTGVEDVFYGSGAVAERASLTVKTGINTNTVITATQVDEAKLSKSRQVQFRSMGSDDLLYASPAMSDLATAAVRITGMSESVHVVPLTFSETETLSMDLGSFDEVTNPNDSMTIQPGGFNANGLKNFSVWTEGGDDSLTIESADLRLPVPGGQFRYLPGLGNDQLYAIGDTSFNLNNSRLSSTAGGQLVFSSFEQAILIGGSGNNTLNAIGFTGTVALYGLDGDDILRGTANSDYIYGGFGDDKIYGGRGNDFLYGEEGKDTFYFDGTTSNDDLRLNRNSEIDGYFDQYALGSNQVLEQDYFNYDELDRVEIRAVDGDDDILVDLAFAILGTVNGGNGADSCVAPSGWTKISC
jgi:RTX calcium-binding nonapeptide repeat (4 copies)